MLYLQISPDHQLQLHPQIICNCTYVLTLLLSILDTEVQHIHLLAHQHWKLMSSMHLHRLRSCAFA